MTEQIRKRRNWRNLQAMKRAKERRALKIAPATGKAMRRGASVVIDKLDASKEL